MEAIRKADRRGCWARNCGAQTLYRTLRRNRRSLEWRAREVLQLVRNGGLKEGLDLRT